MHTINSPDMPATTGGYVPYFYEAGLFQVYSATSNRRSSAPYVVTSTGCQLASDTPSPGCIKHGPTVEQIISNGYFAIPQGDPITAIISDKQQTSWLGLDDVISQIRNRREIYDRNLYQIELGKCAAMNSLYAHEAYRGPPTDKQFYSRHKRLQELYEQQREERTSLWKDISRLRMALPESAQLYLSASRKMSVLQDSTGGQP